MVIAVDPGKTTGIAWLDDGGLVESRQLEFYHSIRQIHDTLAYDDVQALVVENFVPRRSTAMTWQPDALHVIGALRYLAARYRVPFILQNPIPKPRQMGLERELKERGWWKPSEGGHENSARKHLLMYLQKTEEIR